MDIVTQGALPNGATSAAIRLATVDDAAAIQRIYQHYVDHTLVTFETEVPTIAQMRARIENTLERFPYLVCEMEGEVAGYCYASSFRPRSAYEHSAEVSIYLDQSCKGQGIGRMLYEALIPLLACQNVFDLYACIAFRDLEDAILDQGSIRFHEKLGFSRCGFFKDCGYKLGSWCDMVWMHRQIAKRPDVPERFIPFSSRSSELP